MRLNLTLFILLLISFTADAQKLTGVWRGFFSSANGVYKESTREETYKYEIQIDQQTNNGLNGVTYSYKSTIFYGKAELHGIFTASSKSLIIKETKLVELKVADKSEPCLMTCYLDYSKIGKLEVLEGTFISINVKDKGDCGSGKVYLERVATSDFKMEDFLVKKKATDSNKTSGKILINPKTNTATNNKPKPVFPQLNTNRDRKDNVLTKPVPLRPATPPQQKPLAKNVPRTAPPVIKKQAPPPSNNSKNNAIAKNEQHVTVPRPAERIPEEGVNTKKDEILSVPHPEAPTKKMPVPRVLLERENNLVKTITTSEEELLIEFYDSGTIDNDTITVYHNNELVISHGRLSLTPLSFRVKSSKTDNHHEIIVVADNLGDIPPNTASMIIKGTNSRKERYEIILESTETRNAKVVINYVPKE